MNVSKIKELKKFYDHYDDFNPDEKKKFDPNVLPQGWKEHCLYNPKNHKRMKVRIPNDISAKDKLRVQRFLIDILDFSLIIFDMDQTAFRLHSGGALERGEMEKYANSRSLDFEMMILILLFNGIKVGIATFSDQIGIEKLSNWTKETHISGREFIFNSIDILFRDKYPGLANYLLPHCYGIRPTLHGKDSPFSEYPNDKRIACRMIADSYGVDIKETILFDDSSQNIDSIREDKDYPGKAYLVDWENGFRFEDNILYDDEYKSFWRKLDITDRPEEIKDVSPYLEKLYVILEGMWEYTDVFCLEEFAWMLGEFHSFESEKDAEDSIFWPGYEKLCDDKANEANEANEEFHSFESKSDKLIEIFNNSPYAFGDNYTSQY